MPSRPTVPDDEFFWGAEDMLRGTMSSLRPGGKIAPFVFGMRADRQAVQIDISVQGKDDDEAVRIAGILAGEGCERYFAAWQAELPGSDAAFTREVAGGRSLGTTVAVDAPLDDTQDVLAVEHAGPGSGDPESVIFLVGHSVRGESVSLVFEIERLPGGYRLGPARPINAKTTFDGLLPDRPAPAFPSP